MKYLEYFSGKTPRQSPPGTSLSIAMPLPCQCGVKQRKIERVRRVVGGRVSTVSFKKNTPPSISFNSQPGEWPWIVVMSYAADGSNMGSCAGTLIADKWVVTAAHCLDGYRNTDMSVVINEHRIYPSTLDEQDTNLGR